MMMHHRMYLRRCSMSSISEESETGDDEQLDEEFIICNDSPANTPHGVEEEDDDEEYEVRHQSSSSTAMETCLDDLNSFKEVSALCYVRYFAYFLLTDSSISRFLFFSFKHRCVCLMIVVSLHFLRLIRIHPV